MGKHGLEGGVSPHDDSRKLKKKKKKSMDGGAGAGAGAGGGGSAQTPPSSASKGSIPRSANGSSSSTKKKAKLQRMFDQEVPDSNGHAIADKFDPDAPHEVKCADFFGWFINPVPVQDFWSKYYQKSAFVVKRHNPNYYEGWYSKKQVDETLRKHECHYSRDLDIARYVDAKRETLNPEGPAAADDVWQFYEQGSSVRILRPHEHTDKMWQMVSLLEEHWGSGGGANVYLTPPGAQGFAPHYDDIEAFIFQVEGSKNWRVYKPRNEDEDLGIQASRDFAQDELPPPCLTVTLNQGDFLYIPRGWIHQAVSAPDEASMHVTVSCAHRHSWNDYLSAALPVALEFATTDLKDFRQAMPRGFEQYMGMVHQEDPESGELFASTLRSGFAAKVQELWERMLEAVPVDAAADHMVKQFLEDRLPPYILPEERAMMKGGKNCNDKVAQGTVIRLVRPNLCRMMIENDECHVYHAADNARIYHAMPLTYLTFDIDQADGVEWLLLNGSDDYLVVRDMPLSAKQDRTSIVQTMLDAGLLFAPADMVSDPPGQ